MLLFPHLTGKLGEQQFKFLRLQNKLNRIDFVALPEQIFQIVRQKIVKRQLLNITNKCDDCIGTKQH